MCALLCIGVSNLEAIAYLMHLTVYIILVLSFSTDFAWMFLSRPYKHIMLRIRCNVESKRVGWCTTRPVIVVQLFIVTNYQLEQEPRKLWSHDQCVYRPQSLSYQRFYISKCCFIELYIKLVKYTQSTDFSLSLSTLGQAHARLTNCLSGGSVSPALTLPQISRGDLCLNWTTRYYY